MKYLLLGKSGLRVSEVCLGTMNFIDTLPWGCTPAESRRIFEVFAEAGGNFLDTDGTYARSECLLREYMGVERDRFVVGTKYTSSDPGNDPNSSGNHRKSLMRAVDNSLRRLGTDYIDVLWLTAWDRMTPVAEILRALDDLVRAGKILYTGVSNTPAWFVAQANTLAECSGWTPFVGAQVSYNLLQRDAERELLPMARALDVGVTAWTPLASGYLTGKYSAEPAAGEPRRLDHPIASRFVPRSERNACIAAEVGTVAATLGWSSAQVALTWLEMQRVIPVVGARTALQMQDNLGCIGRVLPGDHLQRLDAVSKLPLGYPHDFLSAGMVKAHLYGGMFAAIENHRAV